MSSTAPCNPPPTNTDKRWPYVEYYLGERDEESRKNGEGRHHWSGSESLEWYIGHMLRDTMHGDGDYRWRYGGPDHLATTYEGRFYNNSMHGYGLMSYLDGRVFNGLFHKNFRWGPGVETHACLVEDVGLWYGCQLIRLAWRPAVPSVAIDFVSTPLGVNTITPHRILLTTNYQTIGEVNSALELLKQSGCEPRAAAEKWPQLYAKNCTDLSSPLCQVEAFDRAYYKNGINTLTEVTQTIEQDKDSSQSTIGNENPNDKTIYYAWNNNKSIIHMMNHCFTHDDQVQKQRLNIENILSGSRTSFKRAGKHEMDCRSLLMASYLGFISNVATLINECDVLPDVADSQGNSAIMYAACGDQPNTIHFLMEAGGEVDTYNDACCTPLGITLLRYALEKRGVAYTGMLQALLPPPTAVQQPPQPDENILEWRINRDGRDIPVTNGVQKYGSKTKHHVLGTKISTKEISMRKKSDSKQEPVQQKSGDNEMISTAVALTEDKHMYDNINTQYLIRVAEAYSEPNEVNPIPYIFDVNDMCKDVELFSEEEIKKVPEKPSKKAVSKIKEPLPNKPSRDELFHDKDEPIEEVTDPRKQEKLSRIMLTILQLLSEGADPRKMRCPQPPLFIAAVSGNADLIRQLVRHGADVNEVYPQVYGYSILDVAVSGPLTNENLEVIQALLECGANPDHRLKLREHPLSPTVAPPDMKMEVEGPTLLHAVLARKIESEGDNARLGDLRGRLLELLLRYGSNPHTQYKGHSAVDVAMNKNLDLFHIFLKSPRTDLNAVINESNQTILVKMFLVPFCSTIPLSEKIQILTNLLLFGADPLIKCRNGEQEFGNLFVFAKSVLNNMQTGAQTKSNIVQTPGQKAPPKKPDKKAEVKQKKSLKLVASKHKISEESSGDYKQAVDLVVECARLLYIRWLQAKLMKELIEVVYKYKHRHWTMILKEHNNKKCTSLWLNAHRGLEIWDILKTTKKKIYDTEKILKQVLCIIHFYFMRTKILRFPSITKSWQRPRITFQEKEFIENEVANFTREHKLATMSGPDLVPPIRPYVTPELTMTVTEVEKFNVCFDCAMPLQIEKIPCDLCEMITFCSFECMKTNIDRMNCHPCSEYLKEKYFPSPEEAENNSEEIQLL